MARVMPKVIAWANEREAALVATPSKVAISKGQLFINKSIFWVKKRGGGREEEEEEKREGRGKRGGQRGTYHHAPIKAGREMSTERRATTMGFLSPVDAGT